MQCRQQFYYVSKQVSVCVCLCVCVCKLVHPYHTNLERMKVLLTISECFVGSHLHSALFRTSVSNEVLVLVLVATTASCCVKADRCWCVCVRKMLGLLYHRFHSHMDSGKLLELYVCLIRPVLESGAIVSPIWLRMWSCLNVVRSLLYVYA